MNISQARQADDDRTPPLLQNRVALVTGASRGIGAATAKMLAQHGAAVGVNYVRNREAALQVVKAIEAQGGRALAVQADVGNASEVERMVEQVRAAFGPIDTLILNAAALEGSPFLPIADLEWEPFSQAVLGELRAVFYPIKAVLPSMRKQRSGCIIAVSSGLSRRSREGSSILSVGKASIDAFIRTLATELGQDGIRANLVAPGLVVTDASTSAVSPQMLAQVAQQIPLKRVGQPEDVAGAILLLASDQAKFITGAYLPVSGGQLML